MANTKAIVFTLGALREPRRALFLTHLSHLFATTGKDFMRIGLMTHIPNQAIMGRIKYLMQSNG